MVEAGASLHLVDWVPGLVAAGVSLSIIELGDTCEAKCLYCNPVIPCPQSYCRNYQMSSKGDEAVCDNFEAVSDTRMCCGAFERGERPAICNEDVTGGYAGEFGRRVDDELDGVRSWKQAFARAAALASSASHHATSVTIPDASVQLVTSSMVISQFDHEHCTVMGSMPISTLPRLMTCALTTPS